MHLSLPKKRHVNVSFLFNSQSTTLFLLPLLTNFFLRGYAYPNWSLFHRMGSLSIIDLYHSIAPENVHMPLYTSHDADNAVQKPIVYLVISPSKRSVAVESGSSFRVVTFNEEDREGGIQGSRLASNKKKKRRLIGLVSLDWHCVPDCSSHSALKLI